MWPIVFCFSIDRYFRYPNKVKMLYLLCVWPHDYTLTNLLCISLAIFKKCSQREAHSKLMTNLMNI